MAEELDGESVVDFEAEVVAHGSLRAARLAGSVVPPQGVARGFRRLALSLPQHEQAPPDDAGPLAGKPAVRGREQVHAAVVPTERLPARQRQRRTQAPVALQRAFQYSNAFLVYIDGVFCFSGAIDTVASA